MQQHAAALVREWQLPAACGMGGGGDIPGGMMSRMGSASVATVAEQSSFDPGSVMFFLLPPIIMAEVRQQPSRSPLVR